MRYPITLVVAAFTASIASAQTLEHINPAGLSSPATYSHVVKAGKTLYIAGHQSAPSGVPRADY